MLVTLFGIVTEAREEHLEKALTPILVTYVGIFADITFGLQSITVLFRMSSPSISVSPIDAPQ